MDLFEIGPDRTRVGLIQYSDQIRHEFDLNQYTDKASVLRAITETQVNELIFFFVLNLRRERMMR